MTFVTNNGSVEQETKTDKIKSSKNILMWPDGMIIITLTIPQIYIN